MTAIIQSPTAGLENERLQESQEDSLENLTDTERRVLTALLIADSDREAIELSPVKERQFYNLKSKLIAVKEQIKAELKKKSEDMLTGAVTEASRVFIQGLNAPSFDSRFKSAKEILDRALGKPLQRSELKSNEAITVLNINASPQELESLKHPLSTMEPDNTDSAKAPDV